MVTDYKPSIKSLTKNISFVNFFHLLLNQGINVISALIVTPILFGRLGDESYAIVNLSLTIIMMFTILVNYGFNLNAPKKLALIKNDIRQKEALVNEMLLTRVLLAIGLVLMVVMATVYLGLFARYKDVLLLSSILLMSEAFFPMFVLQGLDRLSWISRANAGAKIVYMIAIAVVIKGPSEAKWANFILGGITLVANIILFVLIYKKEAIVFRWKSIKGVKKRLVDNFEFFLSTIAGHISVHSGLIVLDSFVEDDELGKYALAQKVAFLLRMVPVFITQSILQNASRLYESDRSQFRKYIKKAYMGGLGLTFVLGLGITVMADWIVRVVGGEYVDYSANILRVVSFIPFLSTLNVANMVKILVADYKDVLAKAAWITAVIMISFSCILSWQLGGIGLAIALVLTEVISFLVHYLLIMKRVKI